MLRAAAIALFCSALACNTTGGTPAPVVVPRPVGNDVYMECQAVCLRPSDCQMAYNDDGTCPAGFLCSRDFRCTLDGGARD
jgi:hypothetical protein